MRKAVGRSGWNKELTGKEQTLEDLKFANYVKEILDSDTKIALISSAEKFLKAGVKNVCVHKGLFPPSVEKSVPNLRGYVDINDVGQAAKDWPQLNFVIYHSGYRYVGDLSVDPALALAEFERTGRIAWVSDLTDIPAQYGVENVYGDLGQVVAMTLVGQPHLCAATMGILLRGLGHERVCWGTDALWTGSPQWQIEGLRRLEIPDEMQRKHGFKPLGTATGPVKTAIFSGNNARLYDIDPRKAELHLRNDQFARIKAEYESAGPERSNLRYGYVNNNLPSPGDDQGR